MALATMMVAVNAARAAEWNGGSDWALFDVPERRAMWVWDMGADNAKTKQWDGVMSFRRGLENYKGSRDLFLDFCQNKSVRSIYVFNVIWEWDQATIESGRIPNEAAWVELMADATSRGIQVWMMGYLWDNIDDSRMTQAANKEAIKKIMQAIAAFNQAHPTTPIAGFHNDQEPRATSVYDDMLDTLKIGQNWVNANAPGLKISQALHNVWRGQNVTWNSQSKSMINHIIDTIGHTAYMAYSDTPSTVLNTYAKPACDYAAGPSVGKRVAVGLEVTDLTGLWTNSDKETWWEEIRAEPTATRFKTDVAAPVTFEDCLHDTANALSANAGYDRIVLHESASYFGHWFGMYPRDYILAQSGGTYVSANPQKVNLLTDTKPLVGMGPGNLCVDVVATDASASETGPDSGTYTFTRYGSTASPLTVHYTVSGTAVSGADFASIGTSVVIPAGQSSATVILTPTVDATEEAAETVVVTLEANAAYTIGLSAATVNIATPGFNIGSISGATTEAGGSSTFTVRLNTQPTANVTIGLATSDATEGSVSPSSLTFTNANWNLAQTVTVTGVDDAVIDGNIAYSIVTGSATSSDPNYNGLNPADVPVINNDNDVPGFVVSAISGSTTEAGGVAIFTVRLSAPPTASVVIGLTSSDTTEGTVSPSSLTFTTSNWSTNQTVTVTGVDDAIADSDIAYSIVTAAATSTDSNYNGLNPADVAVTNTDNDYTMTHWWKLDGN
ncbi:MAG TPA: Calx-beta domain-containing protein, partial [Luteolibacter sp.]|nr:Calx-beta domain-containing protein [Luteolibacter sp.]